KEREVMLRLKEVVDKQRDEIRAQAHEIVCKSRDTEALQEQLNRFMCMNEDLRHKVAVVQAQLKSALEKKSDLEAVVLQTQREMSRRTRTASEAQPPKPSLEGAPLPAEEDPLHQGPTKSPAHCCFSKEELQQILQERNELKTNLFLVQEELAYYQRELLNEERIPSFFLDAMKSTIKKQRRKIRAKMLGTAEEPAS
ncbi:Rab-interacting lysosomal protein, partial [Struthio camelus australis]